MTDTKRLATILVITTILISSGLGISPFAYSTGSDDDDDDKDWDWKEHNDDKNWNKHDDDCECEKPTKFTVVYNGPGIEGGEGTNAEVTIEIYKKEGDIGKDSKKLQTIVGVFDGEEVMIDSGVWGKKQIESNTLYRVLQNEVEIAVVSFHTSCSKPLFIGDKHSDGLVTLTVDSGFDHKGRQSIFLKNDPICEGATLTIKKILTPEDDTGRFILQIDGQDVNSEPVGNDGTTGPVVITTGMHSVGERAADGTNLTDYTSTIGGDCNEDGNINLKKGQHAICTITNIKKIPAMITLKKAVTNDNTDQVNHKGPQDFVLTITNIDTNEQKEIPHNTKTNIKPGTYTLSETGPVGYNFVLIAGDPGCPSALDTDKFTIKEGEHLTCTVYNDDDKDAVESDGPGVIFHFESLKFSFDDDSFGDSCDNGNTMPCIELANAHLGTILVVDEEITSDTIIYLFSVIEENKINNPRPIDQNGNPIMGVLAASPLCIFNGLSPHDTGYALQPIGDPDDVGEFDDSVDNPTGVLGFAFTCTLASPTGDYNVNYALIETE